MKRLRFIAYHDKMGKPQSELVVQHEDGGCSMVFQEGENMQNVIMKLKILAKMLTDNCAEVQKKEDGPGEEDGPWAEGWAERCGKISFKDGEPCKHPGCKNHVSHPCEVCGRYAAQGDVVL